MNDRRFAVCIETGEYIASLEPRKLYEVLSDFEAETHGQLRIIDESGEDYLYPSNFFILLDLPKGIQERVSRANVGCATHTVSKLRKTNDIF